jgi:branched-chain amino acid transport system permease protein
MVERLMSQRLMARWQLGASEGTLPLIGLVVATILALLPAFGLSNYLLHILVLVFVYVSLGLGLNIVVGFAGLLDLGYVAFYAIGAYTYALLSVHYHVSFIPALVIGACLAAAFGVVLGWPTIRTRGDYLALVTLGFGEIIRLILRNWDAVTNGPKGIMSIPSPVIAGVTFSTPTHFYYLGLALAALTLTISWRVKYSAVGCQLAAIRDDEDAASAIGINPVRWKLYAFAFGAFVAGMAGVFFASWQRFVSPESFTLGESILILSIVVLGGMGRLWPTIIAAAFLVLLPEALRGLETYRILVLGTCLVLVVILQERLRLLRLNRHTDLEQSAASNTAARLSLPEAGPKREYLNSDDVILSLHNVTKSFGGVRALRGVSLNLHRGEVLGLVGLNGAGKTTLFNCVAGVTRPDSGEIQLKRNGHPITLNHLPAYKIAREGLVRTFQQPRLFPSLTAGENTQLGLRCKDVPKLWEPFWSKDNVSVTDDARQKLQFVGALIPEAEVANMSFVDQKLTELARALATGPDVLLLDEPASGMEPAARERLARVLRRANVDQGVTIIVVEHDLNFLGSICDRIVVIDRGQVAADGAPNEENVTTVIRQTYHAIRGGDNAA